MQNDELLRAKATEKLAAEKYINLYDFAPSGYFTLSEMGDILELNFAGASMLGKERSLLVGRRFSLFIAQEARSDFNCFLERVFESGRLECCDITLISAAKPPVFAHNTGTGNISENGRQCFITAIDITERRHLENELIRAKEHAQENDRLKTAFLQNVSHEIRNPMNAIVGFSRLLVKHSNNKLKLEEFTEIIRQRAEDLLKIINDILEISKIESGQLPVHTEECDLNGLFNELMSLYTEYRNRAGKRHIVLNIKADGIGGEDTILIDRTRLKQIFINLIDNSFKYTDKGIITAGCKLDTGSRLLCYVSDTGIGIPFNKQKKIFDRFVRLRSELGNGTGLGLSIVKGLVQLLGGRIWLKSKPGEGSTFYFSVPYKKSLLKNKGIDTVIEPGEYNFHNKIILLVEDDPFNSDYIRQIINGTGAKVLVARTGNEAVKAASLQIPDLVLMDIKLPDITGYQAAKKIKRVSPHLKFIAQTAYASDDEKQKAFKAGFNDYISKPFDSNIFLSMVNKHLFRQ
jgi:signal transduction histidine kinase/CheY-like chemotaxis protein